MDSTVTRVYVNAVSAFLEVPVAQLRIRGVYALDSYKETSTIALLADSSDAVVVDLQADIFTQDDRDASPIALLELLDASQGPAGQNFTAYLKGELQDQLPADAAIASKISSLTVQSLSVLLLSAAPSSAPSHLATAATRSPSTPLQAVLGDSLKGLSLAEVIVVVVLTLVCCLGVVVGLIWGCIRLHRKSKLGGKVAKYPGLDAVAHRLDVGATRVLFGRAPINLSAIDDEQLQRDLSDPEKWLGAESTVR